jgi:hypothetical protein
MLRGSVVLLVAIVFLGACAGTTRGVVREVVQDSIDEGAKARNWDKLRAPIHDLAGEVAKGVIDGVPIDPAAVERFVRTVLHAASQGLETDVSPAMAHAVRATVDEVLAAILSDGTKRGVAEITNALTAAAMAGLARGFREQMAPAIANALDTQLGPAMQRLIEKNLGPAFAATLQRDLGPAFAATLRDNLGPAFAATLRDNLGPAFAATLRNDLGPAFANAAQRTSTAVGAGFVEGTKPLVDRVQSMIDRADQDAHSILRIVLVVILAIVTGVLAVLLWFRHRAANTGRDALQLVTSEIGRMSAEPVIVELARRIKAAGEGCKAGAFLADHLHAHPSSKVKPPLQA